MRRAISFTVISVLVFGVFLGMADPIDRDTERLPLRWENHEGVFQGNHVYARRPWEADSLAQIIWQSTEPARSCTCFVPAEGQWVVWVGTYQEDGDESGYSLDPGGSGFELFIDTEHAGCFGIQILER